MLEWIVSSAALCALVIGLRYLLRGKISLRLQYALWGLALLRLLLPVSFGGSRLSVMNALPGERELRSPAPTAYAAPAAVTSAPLPAAEPLPISPGALTPIPREETQPQPAAPTAERPGADVPAAEPEKAPPDIGRLLRYAWLAGAAACLLWFLGVNLRFALRLRRSRERFAGADCRLPVYVTAAAETPCLFGLFPPAVYLPPAAAEDPSLNHILAHEYTHFRHGDQVWSLLRSLAIALHWFDPLVWWAAFLSRRDGELACDEGTLRRLGEGERTAYGMTLLRMTCSSRPALFRAATTMTGSKGSLRERIRLIAKRPKTALLALVALVLIAALGAACTFTGARKPADYTDEWFTKTAWPYAEEYARATGIRFEKEGAAILRYASDDYVEVAFHEAGDVRSLVVGFKHWADGSWHTLEANAVNLADPTRWLQVLPAPGVWGSNPEEVLLLAQRYVQEKLNDVQDELKLRVLSARLTGLTPMDTPGAAEGWELYRLEYRFLLADPEQAKGLAWARLEGDELTEQTDRGQPYLLLRREIGEISSSWTFLCATDTEEIETVFGTPEMLEKYGDMYAAAGAELYAAYRDSPEPLAEEGEKAGTGAFNLVELARSAAEACARENALILTGEVSGDVPAGLEDSGIVGLIFTTTREGIYITVNCIRGEDGTWALRGNRPVNVVDRYRGVRIENEVTDAPFGAVSIAQVFLYNLVANMNSGLPWEALFTAGWLPTPISHRADYEPEDEAPDVNRIVRARLTGLTPMGTGAAGLTEGRELYRLEYRLLPEDQENIVLCSGMRTEEIDGETWITEWTESGQQYLLIGWQDPDGDPYGNPEEPLWTWLGTTNTRMLEETYGTPEMLEKYGDRYTAAAAELYAAYLAGENAPSVRLNREDFTLANPGDSFQMTVNIPPALRNAVVSWFSKDPNVATVSTDGLVTAVDHGTTKIEVWVGMTKAQCTVRVSGYAAGAAAEPADRVVSLNRPDITMRPGDSFQLTAAVASSLLGKPVVWLSEDPRTAMVSQDGFVTAVSQGVTKIIASVGEHTAECIVRVQGTASGPEAEAGEEDRGITLDRSVVSLYAGAQYRLTLSLAPELAGTEVVWSSGDPEIASVSPEGLVSAVGWGTTRVYAAAGDRVTDCVIMVTGYARRGREEDGYPVNERGETYGGIKDLNGVTLYPDLEAAAGFTPEGEEISGYVRTFDLENGGPVQHPRNPAEAIAYTAAMEELRREALEAGRDYLYSLPLYDRDGVTVIGFVPVGNV